MGKKTVKGILRKAVSLFWQSCKPMFSTLLIIPILSYRWFSKLSSVNDSSTQNFLMKLQALGNMQAGTWGFDVLVNNILNDLLHIASPFFIEMWTNYLLRSFIVMAFLYIVAVVRESRTVTIKVLAIRIRRTWMGLIATSLYVHILSSGYLGVCMLLMCTVASIGGVSTTSLALIAAMAILVFLLFVHFNMLWSQGVVVSVMEGRSGLDALARAAEYVRGMKGLGFRVNILLLLLAVLAYMLIPAVTTLLPLPNLISFIIRSLVPLLEIVLIHAVNVVFYYECQENQEAATKLENSAYTKALHEERFV